jgi:hypothetical protein
MGRHIFWSSVLFVEKNLCGNVLCTYGINLVYNVVPRVRHTDRQNIADLKVVDGIKIVILISLRVRE